MPSSKKYTVGTHNRPVRTWNESSSFKGKWRNFRKGLWNSETREFAGRSGASWGWIGLFYFILYACLAGIFASMLTVLLKTMDTNVPRRVYNPDNLGEQFINSVPGMGYRPKASRNTRNTDYPEISFSKSQAASYSGYTADLDAYLKSYESTTEQNVSCGAYVANGTCNLRLSQLGPCIGPNYGFNESKPCVLLKINRIINWVPKSYSSNPAPALLGTRWTTDHIGVSCEGYTASDVTNIGTLSFYPSNGFSFSCFPYCRLDIPYLSPVVMVQFNNLAVDKKTEVWCKAWFANMGEAVTHKRHDRNAGVRFSVLMNQ